MKKSRTKDNDAGSTNNRPKTKYIIALGVVAVAIYFIGGRAWKFQAGRNNTAAFTTGQQVAQAADVASQFKFPSPVPTTINAADIITDTIYIQVTPTYYKFPTNTPTPIVVTATPTPSPIPTQTPHIIYEYIETISECPTVTQPIDTATPALGTGVVRVCVRAAGIKGIWFDGLGLVDGQCVDMVAGIGSSDWILHVNR